MSDTNEQRQAEYLELVQALCQCPQGEEDLLLSAHPDLVDERLVMALLTMSEMLSERQDPDAAGTIEWLFNFATLLAADLGLDLEDKTEVDNNQIDDVDDDSDRDYLDLIEKLFKCESGTEDAILDEHQDLVDAGLVMTLTKVTEALVEEDVSENAETIEWLNHFTVELISVLGLDIANKNLENPQNNEVKEQSYLQLIEKLLQCEVGKEYEILSAHPDFVDETLLMSLMEVANTIRQENCSENDSTVEWLDSFNSQLASGLKLEQLKFFITVLLAIINSGLNSPLEKLYSLLQENLPLINEKLILVVKNWFWSRFTKIDKEHRQFIATLAVEFGVLIQQFLLGNRSINLEIALTCYQLALETCSYKEHAELWAVIQMNLAYVYLNRIEGERASNIEKAISCARTALQVPNYKNNRENWIKSQFNLATAYLNRSDGDRINNTEKAIQRFQIALKQCIRDEDTESWIMIQMSLVMAYAKQTWVDRSVNSEKIIQCSKLALEVCNRKSYPEYWALAQMNFAIGYLRLAGIEQSDNIEESIKCSQLALEFFTREANSENWAMIQMNLATAYILRIKGERSDNLEESIRYSNLSLPVFTEKNCLSQLVINLGNLATAHTYRIKGERCDNLEESIQYCSLALEICTREILAENWAEIQIVLGATYFERYKLDLSDYLQSIFDGKIDENFIKSQIINDNFLDIEFLKSMQEIQSDSLEKSIQCYHLAFEIFTRESYPEQWARIQSCLMNAHSLQFSVDGGFFDGLNSAIDCMNDYEDIYTRKSFPIDWAAIQANIANVYGMIFLHSKLMSEVTSESLPYDYLKIYSDIKKYYLSALDIYTPKLLPFHCLQTASSLGAIAFRQCDWKTAIETYELAMQAVETSRSWSVNEEIRQQLLKDALSVYENAIQCAINLSNYPQAIQYTERIRSRQLVDLMGTKDLYPDAEIPADIQQYLDEYDRLNRQIQHLREHGSPDSDGTTKATRNAASLSRDNTAIQALEEQKRAQYLKIRAFDPAIAGQIAVEPIDFTAIQKLITTPHTAILTCYTTDNDTHIFIIKQGQQPTLHTCSRQGWSELQQWLQTEWVNPYHNNNSIWQQNLPTLLAEISQRLQLDTLIEQHLTDITELIIVPHLNLHQIPFAALPINPIPSENPLLSEGRRFANGGVPAGWGGSFLGDKFIIRSIPSCQILQYCQQREPITTKHIGTVEDAEDNLLGARYEGEQIAALYSIPTANRLRGSAQATVANYRDLLTRVNRLHSSHHAESRPDNPIESALILANGERITLGDLLLGRRYGDTLDEVFLSACETHVGTATLTDDVATLTTGFLCIGARSVQSTLWSVDDLVTALFDIFYHQERRDGVNRALSLQAAQVRLRNLTGEEFKISHYPRLLEHITQEITTLKQRARELYQQQSTLDKQSEEWLKLAETMKSLSPEIKEIEKIPARLQNYCEIDRPFAKPYYWAAFITQGMA